MKAFIKKIVLLSLALLALISIYGFFCDWFFSSPVYLDHLGNKRAWCLKKESENFDCAVLGSSRAFGSFDMKMLNTLTNKKNVNLGSNGSGYVDNYLILHQFLKNHNTITHLILQVDIYSLNSKESFSNSFHTYQFLPYWNDPTVKAGISQYLDQDEKIVWGIIPGLRYFKYNKYFSPKEVIRRYRLKNKTISPFDSSMGGPAEGSESESEAIITRKKIESRSLDSVDILYLKKIITLCQERNIKVRAYKAPELLTQQEQIINYNDLKNQVSKILAPFNVEYIQPASILETNNKNFFNPTHLNKIGMIEFTKSFSSTFE